MVNVKDEQIGAMPIYVGAHRTKVLLDVDERILMIVALMMIVGIFWWPSFLIAITVFLAGRVLTEKAPHFIDDLVAFAIWSSRSKGCSMPDDVFIIEHSPHTIPFRR